MLREYSVDTIQATTQRDTIYSLLAKRAARDPIGIIAERQHPSTRRWVPIRARDMLKRVRQVAKGLTALGVRPGDMVVIYAPTSYDWGVVDFACAAIGAVSVAIDETSSASQVAHMCRDVTPAVAFAGTGAHAHTLVTAFAQEHCSSYLFTFQSGGIKEVIRCGRLVSDEGLNRIISRVRADDLATIVYTSGLTRQPQGVMLSHRNFTHIVFASYDVLPDMLHAPSRLLLFMPMSHSFARYLQYAAIGAHGVVGYLSGDEHLLADMRTFHPTYVLGTPRVFERVYNAAAYKAGGGFNGLMFKRASRHFIQWSRQCSAGRQHSVGSHMRHAFFMLTVGSSIRSALGSHVRYLACGAVPSSARLVHFFNGIDGITFIQGYGTMQTAAPCLVNYEQGNKVGTVGRPQPGVAVKLAKNHELLIKGPDVFLGYYRQPFATAQMVGPDGWLHTGEIAKIDDDGFVTITGHNKAMIDAALWTGVSDAVAAEVQIDGSGSGTVADERFPDDDTLANTGKQE